MLTPLQSSNAHPPCSRVMGRGSIRSVPMTNQISASIYDKYSVGRSIRPICTRCCFTMTNMIQVCGNFQWGQVFITNTRPDEMRMNRLESGQVSARMGALAQPYLPNSVHNSFCKRQFPHKSVNFSFIITNDQNQSPPHRWRETLQSSYQAFTKGNTW